jgi:hypothetical protein
MTSANLTMNYSISSGENDKTKKDTNEQSQRNGRDDDLFGANTILNDNRRSQLTALKKEEKIKFQSFLTQNYHGI